MTLVPPSAAVGIVLTAIFFLFLTHDRYTSIAIEEDHVDEDGKINIMVRLKDSAHKIRWGLFPAVAYFAGSFTYILWNGMEALVVDEPAVIIVWLAAGYLLIVLGLLIVRVREGYEER